MSLLNRDKDETDEQRWEAVEQKLRDVEKRLATVEQVLADLGVPVDVEENTDGSV